jgi:hypothetical protein
MDRQVSDATMEDPAGRLLWDEARELARDALGDQADDEVLLQEVTEQICEQLKAGQR